MPRTFRKDLLGPARAKLQPKLQMIANGDEEVNACRAEQSAALSVRSEKLLRETPLRRQQGDAPVRASAIEKLPARKKLAAVVSGIEANVFVQLTDVAEDGKTVPGALSQHGRTVRARVPLSKLPALAADPRIAFIEMGESLKAPRPRLTTGEITAPNSSKRRFGREAKHKFGADVLIGIIDVEGFDFSHPDFLDANGKTRFVAIWDQGGNTRPTPGAVKKQFDYGAEFRQQHLNEAIKVAPKLGVAPYDVERQSQMAEGSHGTHVASIAAGNTGVCRRSPIAGVLVALANEDVRDRRRSFYDSTRIADAVDYLVDLAASMKKRLSINISLGTNGHAHDGSGAIGRYLDSIFSIPGRALTVAAGNAGQEVGETMDDIGWIMGRIHTSGRIPAANLTKEIEWEVVGNGQLDLSENELELWFSAQDKFGVSLRTPKGEWTEEILPLEFIENRRLPGGSFISIYNELHHPSNGSNHMAIYLSPNLKTDPVVGVPAGRWVVRLRGIEVRDGKFDGWIERDDPRKLGRVGEKEAWAFPSFFSQQSMVDNSTVSSLGCGNRVITVANYDEARNRINITSSQGPSRDGRTKPDIAAPGTDIAAAKGFFSGNDKWIGMSGTSMAAPYVTGVIGLMLAIEPSLTSAQIEGILRSTAKPLPGANFTWANDAGFGVIDPDACLEQAALVNSRKDRT